MTGTAWGFATCALQSSAVGAPLVETLGLGAAQRLTQFAPRQQLGLYNEINNDNIKGLRPLPPTPGRE